MRLIDNPFYILDVSTTDNRQTIISKAEEKSFFEDSSVCGEAQNILLNIIKRTSAELSWFPNTDDLKIRDICKAIKNNHAIDLSSLDSIARLNACVHNFSIGTQVDVYETGYSVLEIDELFESLDAVEVADIINNDRQKAGIKGISETEVLAELQKIREYISHVITEKAQDFSDDQYAEFATLIAENCIADSSYNDGIVIDDIINQYEIWAQPLLGEWEIKIRKNISNIKSIVSKKYTPSVLDNYNSYEASCLIKLQENVEDMLDQLVLWDKYAQALQVRDTARGFNNSVSKKLAFDIRDAAILLHNEKGYTELAIKITDILSKVFAEIPELIERINKDNSELQRIKTEKDSFQVLGDNKKTAFKSKTIPPKSNKKSFKDFIKDKHSQGREDFIVIGSIVIIAIIILGIAFLFSRFKGNSSNNSGSESSKTHSSSNDEHSEYDGIFVPSNNKNYLEAEQLKSEIEDLKDEIDDMESDLDELKNDIDYYESQYYITGYDFYISYYDNAVDDYNDLYAEYEDAIDEYNDKVNEYNRLIEDY